MSLPFNYDLSSVKFEVTSYGFRLVGWRESILPLGKLARKKYKKKLRKKRLIKKYAKKLVEDALRNFLKEREEL